MEVGITSTHVPSPRPARRYPAMPIPTFQQDLFSLLLIVVFAVAFALYLCGGD